ncbi:MAG: 2Fe-2S iron-sulfur cluster-binding protein, partial [Nitrospinota bacterium]
MEVSFRIFRFDPSRDKSPRYESYSIPWEEGFTVLSALRYIYQNLDRTLAYREYECFRGLCNSCRVSVDGRELKGCRALLEPGREYTLEPLRGRPIIRDLVVDFGVRE